MHNPLRIQQANLGHTNVYLKMHVQIQKWPSFVPINNGQNCKFMTLTSQSFYISWAANHAVSIAQKQTAISFKSQQWIFHSWRLLFHGVVMVWPWCGRGNPPLWAPISARVYLRKQATLPEKERCQRQTCMLIGACKGKVLGVERGPRPHRDPHSGMVALWWYFFGLQKIFAVCRELWNAVHTVRFSLLKTKINKRKKSTYPWWKCVGNKIQMRL